jgi:hypothetical protein
MKKLAIWLSVAVVTVLMNGCGGGSSTTANTASQYPQTDSTSESGYTHRQPSNTPPVAYAGKDRKVEIGDDVKINAELIPDKDGDKLAYIWTLIDKPEGSQADMRIKYSTSRQTVLENIDEFGNYTVALLVRDENGGTGADTITFSTELKANDFNMYIATGMQTVVGDWKELSNINNEDAEADILHFPGDHGFFDIQGSRIIYTENSWNPLPIGESESATIRIEDEADTIFIYATVRKKTLINGSFETGDLTGWDITIGSAAEVIKKENVLPQDVNATDGQYFLLIDSSSSGTSADVDGNGVLDYYGTKVAQQFLSGPNATLEFDIITMLVDDYWDDIFRVTLDGTNVATGSNPEGSDYQSTFPDFGPIISYAQYTIMNTMHVNGSYDFKTSARHYSIPVPVGGQHVIAFEVLNQGDDCCDIAIAVDNVKITY